MLEPVTSIFSTFCACWEKAPTANIDRATPVPRAWATTPASCFFLIFFIISPVWLTNG